jgi:hypothetical protein
MFFFCSHLRCVLLEQEASSSCSPCLRCRAAMVVNASGRDLIRCRDGTFRISDSDDADNDYRNLWQKL